MYIYMFQAIETRLRRHIEFDFKKCIILVSMFDLFRPINCLNLKKKTNKTKQKKPMRWEGAETFSFYRFLTNCLTRMKTKGLYYKYLLALHTK